MTIRPTEPRPSPNAASLEDVVKVIASLEALSESPVVCLAVRVTPQPALFPLFLASTKVRVP